MSVVLAAALAVDLRWVCQVANSDMRDFYIEHIIAPLAAAPMVDGATLSIHKPASVQQLHGLPQVSSSIASTSRDTTTAAKD